MREMAKPDSCLPLRWTDAHLGEPRDTPISLAVNPSITVVIPTMGRRPQRMKVALKALAEQDLPAGEVEVVIGCDPGAGPRRCPTACRSA